MYATVNIAEAYRILRGEVYNVIFVAAHSRSMRAAASQFGWPVAIAMGQKVSARKIRNDTADMTGLVYSLQTDALQRALDKVHGSSPGGRAQVPGHAHPVELKKGAGGPPPGTEGCYGCGGMGHRYRKKDCPTLAPGAARRPRFGAAAKPAPQ